MRIIKLFSEIHTTIPWTSNSYVITTSKLLFQRFRTQRSSHERIFDFYAKAFVALSRKLTNFKTIIGDTLTGEREGIDVQISSLEGQVQQIKREFINDCVKNAQDASARRQTVTCIGFGIVCLLPIIAPFSLGAHFVSASDGSSTNDARNLKEKEVQENESKLVRLEIRIADLKAQQQDFPVLEKGLNACYHQIDHIALKVGAFGEFWTAVNVDAQFIIKKLEIVIAANITHGSLELGDRGVASLYTSLRQALSHYTFGANV
ncbi:hypothetical protein BDN72DRAFT_902431 [Pluteus cervinus]|uniref:Uncharacterized protein n=1 Tax=Pluteus cervinus TaxID=181527 RepID=A0ACD3ACU1_9AGAR|nr:hypothetical protein BDN72DRAFT_902431 [Pluteus cervinus]